MQMMRKSIAIMLIFAMLMAGALPIGVEAATKRFAKITELSGTVSVQKNGAEKSFKAFKGMSLAEGDSIETGVGSSATLEVDADRTVKIGDNTKVDLTELKGSVNKTKTSVKLWGGKVYVEVNKKLGNDERFDISTPTAVMGVRGTKFYVAYEKNKIRVGVVEGKVEAKVYTFEAKPGQEPTLNTVETMVLPSQEALIPEDAVDQKDVEMKEVELKDLDLFILKEIMKNPEGLSPETLKEIEDEMKRKEAEEAKRIAEQLEALKKLEQQQNTQQPVYENPTQPNELPQNNTPSSGAGGNSGNSGNSGGSGSGSGVNPTIAISAVSVGGTATVGQMLTAITIPENATATYQWMRSNSQGGTYESISGATGRTYALNQMDLNGYLKVVVTGFGNYTGTLTSQPTGKVIAPSFAITEVQASGISAVGQILTAQTTPENATASYQWMRSSTQGGTYENISGATSQSYTLSQTDLGQYLKVAVTGIGNFTGTVMSQPTGVVYSSQLTINTGVGVGGDPIVRKTLTLYFSVSDSQPPGNRVQYFAEVKELENSQTPVGTIPVYGDSMTIPATFQLNGGGTASIVGKYIDYGVGIIGNPSSKTFAPSFGPIKAADYLLQDVLGASESEIETALKALYLGDGDAATNDYDIKMGNELGYYRLIHSVQAPVTDQVGVVAAVNSINTQVSMIAAATSTDSNADDDNLIEGDLDAFASDMKLLGYHSTTPLPEDKTILYLNVINNADIMGSGKLDTYKKIQDFIYMADVCLQLESLNPNSWIVDKTANVVEVNMPAQLGQCQVVYEVSEYPGHQNAFDLQTMPTTVSLNPGYSVDRGTLSGETAKNHVVIMYSCGSWELSDFSDLSPRYGDASKYYFMLPPTGDASFIAE